LSNPIVVMKNGQNIEWTEEPLDDEWLEYDPPEDNPYDKYMSSYREIDAFLEKLGGNGDDLMNRLLFSHQITVFEAFLCDNLINQIKEDREAFLQLITQENDLSKERFTLNQIVTDPDLVNRRVFSYLQSVVWHKLAKAEHIYFIVTGKKILGSMAPGDKMELYRAIEYRNDCVHRNGEDRDGNRLDVFTKGYIITIGNIITSIVMEIEGIPH
jgi:hypothetical protein